MEKQVRVIQRGTISEVLRALLKERGISRSFVSIELGISQNTIDAICLGTRSLGRRALISRIDDLADLLCVPVESLVHAQAVTAMHRRIQKYLLSDYQIVGPKDAWEEDGSEKNIG